MIDDISYMSSQIADAINGELYGKDEIISGISIDSREKSDKPFCFFAIKGKKYDGNDYIDEAIKNGAKLIVSDEKKQYPVSMIYVNDTVKALGLLGKKHKGKRKVVAITGSSGKTTTKDMVVSVLSKKYSVCGTYENQNNEIGVALTLLSIKNEEICVVEMGMRGLGEINWLSYISEPNVSLITNCGKAHIGILGNEDNIYKAKTEILNYTKEYAILPNEDRFKKIDNIKLKKIYIGNNGNYNAKNIKAEKHGFSFDINECQNIKITGIYEHNIYNALNAYAVGRIFDVEDGLIKKGLEDYCQGNGRGKILTVRGREIIDDSYNASYESMSEALKSLSKYAKTNIKKPFALLGDMLELGKNSCEYHCNIGELCRKLEIEKIYVYGRFSKEYISGFGGGVEIKDFSEISKIIINETDENCVVLVKASNAMRFDKIVEELREYNK